MAHRSLPVNAQLCSGGLWQEQETFHSSLLKPLGMLHRDGEKSREEKNDHCQGPPELTQCYQDWERGSQKSWSKQPGLPEARHRGIPRHPNSGMQTLVYQGHLKTCPRLSVAQEERWQQHILAVPAPALSAWSPPCLLQTEGTVGGEQRILTNGLHHALFSLKTPPWNRRAKTLTSPACTNPLRTYCRACIKE